MASDKTNVMRVLEQHKIAYKPHEYPHGKDAVDGVSVAELLGQNPDQVFKTLVARGKSGGFHVFVIPVAKELDLKKAARRQAKSRSRWCMSRNCWALPAMYAAAARRSA